LLANGWEKLVRGGKAMAIKTEERNQHARVAVRILNQEYILKGTESPQYMEMLASHVDNKMRQITQRYPTLSVQKVAVLASLQLADDLIKLREDYDALIRLIEEEKKG